MVFRHSLMNKALINFYNITYYPYNQKFALLEDI